MQTLMRRVFLEPLAGSILALSIALVPAKAQPAISPLTVALTPAAPGADKDIPYVDVRIDIGSLDAPAGRDFLRLPLVSSNVQGVAGALAGFRVSDASGDVRLTSHDDPAGAPDGYRHWSPDRDVNGPVTISYRVPITNALNPRGAAPPLELRTEADGFSGSGGIFLVLPEVSTLFRLSVKWNLSAEGASAIGLSTLGPGDIALGKPERADSLTSVYFMGGDIAHYPDVLSGEGFSSAWQGNTPFDARALMAWTSRLYGYYLGFFHASAKQPYAVFLRRNPVNAGGGVEIGHSFVGTFDKDTKPEALKLTLAHEMVHTFVGGLDSPSEDLSLSWYSEGLAVYYERLLPLRAGEISPDEYLADLNQTAGRYYTDLLNDTPNDEIAARFWADTRVRVLPYDRGALYFAALNGRIRKASGGKRSLDDLVLAMLERRAQGLPANEFAWTSLLQKELGAPGVQSFKDMLAGKLVLPASDAFGPCFRRVSVPLRRYVLGFDTDVLIQPKRIVRGLVTGSAAARAGLRNGDEIVKPVPQDAIQADQHATLTLLIRRGSEEFAITYLPRGEEVEAYQWRRVPGTKDETCRKW